MTYSTVVYCTILELFIMRCHCHMFGYEHSELTLGIVNLHFGGIQYYAIHIINHGVRYITVYMSIPSWFAHACTVQ